MQRHPKKSDPGVLDTACRQLRAELGCTDARAFELLYGWAEACKDAQRYGLTQVCTRHGTLVLSRKSWKKC